MCQDHSGDTRSPLHPGALWLMCGVQAHEDAVRDLAILPGMGFVSVGNDGMLKVSRNHVP